MMDWEQLAVPAVSLGTAGVLAGWIAWSLYRDRCRELRNLAETKAALESSVQRWEARLEEARRRYGAALAACRAPAVPPAGGRRPPGPQPVPPPPPAPDYPDPIRVSESDLPPRAENPAPPPPVSAEGLRWAWEEAACRRGNAVAVPLPPADIPVYAIGDLHGDAKSLQAILAWISAQSRDFRAIFLGDLVDRSPGPGTLACVRLFLQAVRNNPGRFLWLRGNHDFLSWDGDSGHFRSPVSPHDFSDWLEAHPDAAGEGRELCALMASLPVAAVVGNVCLSHGGVLQDDAQGLGAFSGLASLAETMCDDLVWSRMKDAPSKLPGRSHLGAEVGFEQAAAFAARLRETDGLSVSHFVCAHQHEDRNGFGYLAYERCFRLPTCQCVCSFFNMDGFDGPARPAILRLDGPKTPVPVFFDLPVP